MAQREILTLNESTPQVEVPQAGDSYLAPVTLNAATGDEVALDLSVTVNKATSGNYTALKINATETAAPGSDDRLLDLQVGGVSKFSINNAGNVVNEGSLIATGFIQTNSEFKGHLAPVGNDITLLIQRRNFTVADNAVEIAYGTASNSSGQFNALALLPTYNQSGTAAGTDLLINRTETALGSGAQFLQEWQVGGTQKVGIDNTGTLDMDKTTADEGFINFKATADGDATSAISTLTTSGATTHHIQIEINGVTAWIAASTTDPS